MKTYTRMTSVEREQIYRWKQEGKSNAQIAERLDRHPSTIGRELKRNTTKGGYWPHLAQKLAQQRAWRDGYRKFNQAMMDEIELCMKHKQWTPEIICQRARLEGRPFVCKESIYQYVYEDAKGGGSLWKHLPRATRKRRRRCPRADRKRGKIPFRRDIDERPKEVEKRERLGDWEGDLVIGAPGGGNFVTLVERRTRYAMVGHVLSKEADEVQKEISRLLNRWKNANVRRTLTLDNGSEFTNHAQITSETGVEVYFAKPYHSWERGSNENANGLIRRKHPKKSSFEGMNHERLGELEEWLNTRPRKCLGWRTPAEEMSALLG